MKIISLISTFFGSIFCSERSKFRDYVKERGGENVQRMFKELKDSDGYYALRLVWETVSDNVKEHLIEVNPANAIEIAVCQSFANLPKLLDISVSNLSTADLEKEMQDMIKQARELGEKQGKLLL